LAEQKKKTASGKTTAKRTAADSDARRNASTSKNKNTGASAKSRSSQKDKKTNARATENTAQTPTPQQNNTLPYMLQLSLLVVLGVFLAACLLIPSLTGVVGEFLHDASLGLFGCAAYAIPILILIGACFLKKDMEYHAQRHKFVFGTLLVALIGVLFHVAVWNDARFAVDGAWRFVCALYNAGVSLCGGGVIGGLIAFVLRFTGPVGTLLITCIAVLMFALFFVGMTPKSLYITVMYKLYKRRERREAYLASMEPEMEERRAAMDAKEQELHRMRREAAEKQRLEREQRRAQQTSSKHRKNAIDKNIYATDAEYAESGIPVAEEPVSAVEESGMISDAEAVQSPDEAAYAAAETDVQQALEAGDLTEGDSEGSARTEILHPEQEPVSAAIPAEEIDLASIFQTPEDKTLLEKYGPSAASEDPYADRSAEIELAVTKTSLDESGAAVMTDGAEGNAVSTDAEDAQSLLQSLGAMYGTPAAQPEPVAPEYVFPPITLLKKDTSMQSEDVADELEENAAKLTDILRSFNVKTRIVNVSRGPTITRYELQPEAGTRVRSVANLVDDIALGLAADGVRIEAPIPGKSAIGIEVPNHSVSTVYIRDLIDSDAFRTSKSKLTTCLGMDVAGSPIYLDAAKMPHLLICGATGMGKSVCINSLIVSMLYKATPDEVKLILIDPKKVELNIYSGIPHLLVPVVSDPKKAAGALHWSVTEMERRFELIEDVGMRDIKGYNEITKNDPEKEYLPQIVIIIDELADLMMTAPDDVEESICRLAQKARAAGMHLIIGTQRPSVDVITGLIKANIPSRIAFRVSSQMDSRVVLDSVGAEKLIGRGDMLYSPVGSPKPQRVQGSFVSENEIDQITTFLKKTAGHAEYADDVIAMIEKEAAMCGQKKGGRGSDPDEFDGEGISDDPMLKNAIELAVESGKISTSLIQRRLSLGYGRAAKLIDRMEQLGYVSAPEGQKPRQVLITKEQYMEMVLRQEDIV